MYLLSTQLDIITQNTQVKNTESNKDKLTTDTIESTWKTVLTRTQSNKDPEKSQGKHNQPEGKDQTQ